MKLLSTSELRSIKLMQEAFDLFRHEKIDLFDLINNLIGLSNTLESPNSHWKDAFRSEINTLEMLYDSMQDGSVSNWKGDPKEDMNTSILKLKDMLTSLIKEHLNSVDLNSLEIIRLESSNWIICPKCQNSWKLDFPVSIEFCPKCLHTFRILSD